MAQLQLTDGYDVPDFGFDTPWETQQKFYDNAGNDAAVLIFLRYQGCPVCQLNMVNIKKDIALFHQKKARFFVVLQSQPEIVAGLNNKNDWPFTIICDPNSDLFRQFSVMPGGIFKYLHPAGLAAAIKATCKGFRHGKFEGRETQLPALFIVSTDKRITYAYYGKTINDLPAVEILLGKI